MRYNVGDIVVTKEWLPNGENGYRRSRAIAQVESVYWDEDGYWAHRIRYIDTSPWSSFDNILSSYWIEGLYDKLTPTKNVTAHSLDMT